MQNICPMFIHVQEYIGNEDDEDEINTIETNQTYSQDLITNKIILISQNSGDFYWKNFENQNQINLYPRTIVIGHSHNTWFYIFLGF
jgi:hypothetical protein